jgi:hypothetical protein
VHNTQWSALCVGQCVLCIVFSDNRFGDNGLGGGVFGNNGSGGLGLGFCVGVKIILEYI